MTFYGRGYGHGVGLSQYGARGRAAAGQGYAAILAHYFQGTTLGTVANSQIRVLVLNDFAASSTHPLTIYGRTGTFTIDGISKTFPKDARVRIYPTTSSGTTWKVVVTSAGGTTLHDGSIAKSFRIRPAQTSTRLQLLLQAEQPTTAIAACCGSSPRRRSTSSTSSRSRAICAASSRPRCRRTGTPRR